MTPNCCVLQKIKIFWTKFHFERVLMNSTNPETQPTVTAEISPRLRVLLVDDDEEIAESMRYALEQAGFQVTVARNGNQGLAMIEAVEPRLLVLDMMMPKRSGFLVLEELRRQGLEGFRVIMVTGNEGHRHRQYAELLGVDEYLHKPFPMERLVEAARRLTATN